MVSLIYNKLIFQCFWCGISKIRIDKIFYLTSLYYDVIIFYLSVKL